jgi:hypothetical protein
MGVDYEAKSEKVSFEREGCVSVLTPGSEADA